MKNSNELFKDLLEFLILFVKRVFEKNVNGKKKNSFNRVYHSKQNKFYKSNLKTFFRYIDQKFPEYVLFW